jgi:hypothetical protein
MSILCAIAGHEAHRREVYNGGFHFSRCRRCRRDMIRAGGEWRMIPGGHRVTWKAGCHSHSIEPDYGRVLPVLHDQANLPAVRSGFMSWCRQLKGSATARAVVDPDRAAAEAEARASQPYPRLLVIVALVGAGLQLLMGFGGGRREIA